jgi:AraC-like DNA-binding protein
MPRTCRAVNVSPLLKELILACVREGALSARKPSHRRLAGVLLDQLATLPGAPLQLPPPRDGRACRMAEILRAAPGSSLPDAARRCGASMRTMERLFRAETRLTLGAWQRRLRLQLALERLAAGRGVNEVARECGYNGASAFVAMFRRELGATPGRYFASSG